MAASLIVAGLMAGCSGGSNSGTSGATVSGKVADGYLVNAVVFMDKNGNYQLDPGEPSATTDQNGSYTLNVAPEDVGKYPIVAMAIQGQTTDADTNQAVTGTYVMSMPAQAVSGTGTAMVTPMTTLIRENMEANPGMTLTDAMTQLRDQMNLPAGTNMMADYVSLGAAGSTDPNKGNYALMHTAAQNMASLMAGQAAQIMSGTGTSASTDVNRFRGMMGAINDQLSQMVAAMPGGSQQSQSMMNQIAASVTSQVASMPAMTAGMPFRNMSTLFPNLTNARFWNMSGHPISGMMGGKGGSAGTGMMGGSTAGTSGSGSSGTSGTTGGTGTGTGMMGGSGSSTTGTGTSGSGSTGSSGTGGTGMSGSTGTGMTGGSSSSGTGNGMMAKARR
ncbi:hypothetical protein [Geomesophilobacter sediminis]|uniref:Uncharacterized protein n=1 Tax=Geomesophilobacter sediminis TaxID=2798584 RepID=A0A8J7SBW1_9BACT|nr:hypothetical protein [Geomesophilobacter sediminis]MBJ6726614.1 hypothetical protein [Geomesophilobacter sediminis]